MGKLFASFLSPKFVTIILHLMIPFITIIMYLATSVTLKIHMYRANPKSAGKEHREQCHDTSLFMACNTHISTASDSTFYR